MTEEDITKAPFLNELRDTIKRQLLKDFFPGDQVPSDESLAPAVEVALIHFIAEQNGLFKQQRKRKKVLNALAEVQKAVGRVAHDKLTDLLGVESLQTVEKKDSPYGEESFRKMLDDPKDDYILGYEKNPAKRMAEELFEHYLFCASIGCAPTWIDMVKNFDVDRAAELFPFFRKPEEGAECWDVLARIPQTYRDQYREELNKLKRMIETLEPGEERNLSFIRGVQVGICVARLRSFQSEAVKAFRRNLEGVKIGGSATKTPEDIKAPRIEKYWKQFSVIRAEMPRSISDTACWEMVAQKNGISYRTLRRHLKQSKDKSS